MKNGNSKKLLRLLLVEDSPSDAALLQENILSRSGAGDFSVSVAPSLQKALDHLKNNRPDAVLLDLNLPDSTGLGTVERARQTSPDVPIIVLTGVDDEKLGMEAMQAGVQDYLVKGQADGHAIIRAVRYAIERKKFDAALRESEERFKAIAESTPVGIGVVGIPDSKFLYVNPAYQKSFGYTEAEILGKDTPDIYWNIEDRERLLGVLKENGYVAEYEVKLKRKDGTPFWGLSSIRPITYGGKPALLGAFVDISERKAAEETILRAKEEWERTFDSVPDLIALLDRDYHIVRVNKAMAEKMGVSTQEAVGMRCYECVHGTDAPPHFCPHQMMLRDGKEHTAEIHEERLGGDFLVSTTPLFDREGKMVGSVHVARDITERKKIENELKRLSQELEKKVEARTAELKGMNELLRLEVIERAKAEESLAKRQQVLESIYAIETTFSVSIDDVFDQVALTISNLVDLPYVAVGRVDKGRLTIVSQLIDNDFSHEKSIYVFTHPCGIVAREKKVRQYSGKLKELFPEETKALEQDYKSYVGMPITDKEGAVIGVMCAMGLTERTCTDLEIHSIEIFARYLGHEIEHEIMDDQLRISGEMSLLGRIASGVAHEVRNPLNGILAISEALFQDLGDKPEHLPYLEHIKTQVNRLSVLMKDLLDLGKPLTQSEFIPQPLEPIIHSAIDSLRHSVSHKNRTVNFMPALAGTLVMVKADGVKLQQVFFNLIDNACDHSSAGEPITVEMTTAFADTEAVVRVIDKGKGVAPNLLEKVFEPFFSTRKGGTGLGLSIVKRIVELHGGTVSMTNNDPGPGLTVEVQLPICAKQEQAET
jgi:PAS domain S-box-containing protein